MRCLLHIIQGMSLSTLLINRISRHNLLYALVGKDGNRLGINSNDIKKVWNILPFLKCFAFILSTDSTPQLRSAGSMIIPLFVNRKTNNLFAINLDFCPAVNAQTSSNDELLHAL